MSVPLNRSTDLAPSVARPGNWHSTRRLGPSWQVADRGFFACDLLDQVSESRIRIARHMKCDDEQRNQVLGINAVVSPFGDLAQIMLGSELLDFHADDFCEAGRELLRDDALRRRKIEPDERDFESPIDPLRSRAQNHSA